MPVKPAKRPHVYGVAQSEARHTTLVQMITPLPLPELRRLTAAQGWLELGDWQSANDELESIAPQLRAHPDVLKLRFGVYSAAKHWELALVVAESLAKHLPGEPEGWIHRSFALHEMRRTKEAQALLLPAATLFPDHWLIAYNLACYASQLGQLEDARHFLERAFSLGDAKQVKLMALDDADLSPLFGGGEDA